ncbi:hypothetical protein FSP39_012809 [Pinctada imbricata]|uniref:CCHC-type domain-containing protein n=1 Tax=Pinctada imbricata TaxID=66713 RepID=A0AA88Y4Z2_PINIB|nr:hypothetical protein FSP39_012809 [Pinctada imbricata]
MNAVRNMEFNLRPQWRQWTYAPRQEPTCGRCGLTHFTKNCFARDRKCFKCHKIGHYGRVCYSQKQTQSKSSDENSEKAKSKGKKDRDSRRISEYFMRKNIMRELPFSSLRPTAFQETVTNCSALKIELKIVKQKLEMCKKEQDKHIRTLSENLETSKEENDDLKKEVRDFQKRENEMQKKLSTFENLNKELKENLESVTKRENEASEKLKRFGNTEQTSATIRELQVQLDSKCSFIDFITERYHEMQNEYCEKLESEKKFAEKEKRLREQTEEVCREKIRELEATINFQLDLIRQNSNHVHQNRNHGNRPNHKNYRGRGRFY